MSTSRKKTWYGCRLYDTLYAIWYNSHDLNNVKKLQTEAFNFTKSNTPSWVFFPNFRLCKWYLIAPSITYYFCFNLTTKNEKDCQFLSTTIIKEEESIQVTKKLIFQLTICLLSAFLCYNDFLGDHTQTEQYLVLNYRYFHQVEVLQYRNPHDSFHSWLVHHILDRNKTCINKQTEQQNTFKVTSKMS